MAAQVRYSGDQWETQRTPFGWVVVLMLVCCVAGFAAGIWYAGNQSGASPIDTSGVSAAAGRLTLARDGGGHLPMIDCRSQPEVYYRVNLQRAPVGQRLALTCHWIDPGGHVVHVNSYRTRVIDRPSWPTYARYRFGSASPSGKWTVRLCLDGRTLSTTSFLIRDAKE